ncbi:hypothetical protein [Chlorobium sp. N1]|uniref:hypothetical protein n=1 Tax=Chlorobium sp. N1 TaxID=2491138 RepID=UPI001038CAE6|nr:hypothetical protein [Chlorobium sp. N1]TCD48499.1 hypothetical protein E0L29_01020 [Chlorobium sp. N1]
MKENPIASAAAAVGVAGGAALLTPIAAPALHGIAGFALVGLGAYMAGSSIIKATGFVSKKANGLLGEGSSAKELLKGSVFSMQKKNDPAREVPFKP